MKKKDWAKIKQIAKEENTNDENHFSLDRLNLFTQKQNDLDYEVWWCRYRIVSTYQLQEQIRKLVLELIMTRSLARQKELPDEILIEIWKRLYGKQSEEIIKKGCEYYWEQMKKLNYYQNKDLMKLEKYERQLAQIEMPCSWKW